MAEHNYVIFYDIPVKNFLRNLLSRVIFTTILYNELLYKIAISRSSTTRLSLTSELKNT